MNFCIVLAEFSKYCIRVMQTGGNLFPRRSSLLFQAAKSSVLALGRHGFIFFRIIK